MLITRALITIIIMILGYSTYHCSNSENIALARARLIKDTLITRSMISATISDGVKQWEFDASDFKYNPNYKSAWCAPEIKTATKGSLVMQFWLRTRDGDIVSEGQIRLPLKSDWRWGMSIWHEHRNPYYSCWGCFGYKSFSILLPEYKTCENDSIFVVWGGNSISNPVLY